MTYPISPYEPVMIVCADQVRNVPGKWDVCCECTREIFLSDTTLHSIMKNKLQTNELRLYCMDCAAPKMKHIKTFIPLTDEQIAEIERNL